jgi:hypothetical protein
MPAEAVAREQALREKQNERAQELTAEREQAAADQAAQESEAAKLAGRPPRRRRQKRRSRRRRSIPRRAKCAVRPSAARGMFRLNPWTPNCARRITAAFSKCGRPNARVSTSRTKSRFPRTNRTDRASLTRVPGETTEVFVLVLIIVLVLGGVMRSRADYEHDDGHIRLEKYLSLVIRPR